MQIPMLDLKAQYQSIKPEVDAAIQNVLNNCNFIMGEDVKKLEEEVAAYCQVKYGIGVASGTDALVLALWALDLKEGDDVSGGYKLSADGKMEATVLNIGKVASKKDKKDDKK